jgi:hypothetical protein
MLAHFRQAVYDDSWPIGGQRVWEDVVGKLPFIELRKARKMNRNRPETLKELNG